ncbi:hypothetical protein MPH_09590 [Macrophomina phaseolina MS6]|uniref:Uncharacterized protein n=1 Tax=Macrophomina phaseolina (strain MS6) TaxID=1126212 RepID=K2RFA9_MACPH|nr:hypothetical protein MPH_09590 [Macrophomina phaseolina MS6]
MYASALLSALLGASSAAALAIEGRAANVLFDITFHTGTQFSGESRIVQISTPAENSNQLPCQNLQGEAIDNRAQSVEVPPNCVCFFFA